MNKVKKALCIVLSLIITLEIIPAVAAQAASKSKVSVAKFVKELQAAANTKESLMKKGEFDKKNITWEDAVVLTNRADVLLNGDSYSEELYKQVKDKNRLVGLAGLTSSVQKAARICFVKGLIIGESMGDYSQERKFYAENELTRAEVDTLLGRFKDKTKRIKLTSDGQVTRKVALPKNYKAYDYILASFPNEYYETQFHFQRVKYGSKQKRYVDYAYPKDMKKVKFQNPFGEKFIFQEDFAKYGDIWMKTIEENLEARLNFDYRKSGNDWISRLRKTYLVYGDAKDDKPKTDEIKKYVEKAKKNKVIVTADKIAVEPSGIYMESSQFYVRCYVKFKVSADTVYSASSDRQNELIFSQDGYLYFKNLKKNTWYDGFFDIMLATTMGLPLEEAHVGYDSVFHESKE